MPARKGPLDVTSELSPPITPMYLDTNVLLRAATKDPADQASAVEAMLQEAALRRGPALDVASSTVSETIFVLRGKNYEFDRVRIVAFLEGLLALPVRVVERSIIERAVGLYRDVHSDWDDCLLAAYAIERSNGRLVSFDRGLDRIPGLTRIEPTLPAAEGEA